MPVWWVASGERSGLIGRSVVGVQALPRMTSTSTGGTPRRVADRAQSQSTV